MLMSFYPVTKTGSCMVIQITFSSTALNYIYPSLSLSLSVHMSPSIQLMSILPYRVISPHKSLQMHEASVCVISNTVPDLFQSEISIPLYFPPVFDRHAFTP